MNPVNEMQDRTSHASARIAGSWLLISVVCALLVVAMTTLVGCKKSSPQSTEDTTDVMFQDEVNDDLFYVFQYGDKTFTVQDPVSVDVNASMELEDGKFYRVVADVTYLNGGVAGYVNYPEVKTVKSCEEVSPFDIGLRLLEDQYFGVTFVGDYADGDVFALEQGVMALWKDGGWLYRYDKMIDLDDGTSACCRDGVTKEEIAEGKAKGVLACEDYFALPPRSE